MRLPPARFVLVTMLFCSVAASRAEDAPGCADFRQAPRAQGCRIVECGYKRHDSVAILTGGEDGLSTIEGSIVSVNYSCAAGISPLSIAKNLETTLKNSRYQILSRDFGDPLNPSFTARLNSQYLELDASRDDDTTSYWLTLTHAADSKSAADLAPPAACHVNEVASEITGCVITECSSKLSETVQMQASAEDVRSLDGAVAKVSLECSGSRGSADHFKNTQAALKSFGYELLYAEPADGGAFGLTARKGKFWVEVSANHDDDSNAFTVVRARVESDVPFSRPLIASLRPTVPLETPIRPAAALAPSVHPVILETPKPPPEVQLGSPAPEPTLVATRSAPPSIPVMVPAQAQVPEAPSRSTAQLVPPKPAHEIPLDLPERLRRGIQGDLVVKVTVDVDSSGKVTHAVLSSKPSKAILKLESAAIDTAHQWQFEPARLGDQKVNGKTEIEFKIAGEPIRPQVPSFIR